MANGIGNNESKRRLAEKPEKKVVNRPAEKDERSNVTVSRFADTLDKGITGFKGIAAQDQLKEQIRNGEYKAIKLSDKPVEIKKEEKEENNKQGGTGR